MQSYLELHFYSYLAAGLVCHSILFEEVVRIFKAMCKYAHIIQSGYAYIQTNVTSTRL